MMWGAFLAEHAWQLSLMAALLSVSGYCSGTETALFNLSKGQLYRLRHSRGPGALVADLMTRPRRILHTLLLSNMLVNVAFAGIATAIVFDLAQADAPAWAGVLASLAALLTLILFGEVAPKMLAYAVHERWALLAAAPLAGVERILAPPLWLLERAFVHPLVRMIAPRQQAKGAVDNRELAAVLELSAKRGIIDRDATALLQEIVSLSDLRVADIMVPRVDITAYDVNSPRDGLLKLIRQTHLRKIPVYEGNLDRIIGLVHAKRLLLKADASLRELVAPITFVPEAANVERLLMQFCTRHTQTAIVVDEYGGTAGLVTLEDVLEQIVGDLPDARDLSRGPAVAELGGGRYELDANLAIHEWADAFKIDLSGERISTIGGFVTSLLGRIPQVGDAATYRNLRFTVESMRGRRIGKLRLELLEGSA
ncbi:MAG TPA: hemolysin family protein [Phycisphaerae bacterium]|nr:hemolysin family protein [Phycisphaerae bacterium]